MPGTITQIIDSHCHVYPQAIAQKAVKGVSDFYDGVGTFCDGLASSVRRLWPEKALQWAEENMIPYYPLGVYKDKTKEAEV